MSQVPLSVKKEIKSTVYNRNYFKKRPSRNHRLVEVIEEEVMQACAAAFKGKTDCLYKLGELVDPWTEEKKPVNCQVVEHTLKQAGIPLSDSLKVRLKGVFILCKHSQYCELQLWQLLPNVKSVNAVIESLWKEEDPRWQLGDLMVRDMVKLFNRARGLDDATACTMFVKFARNIRTCRYDSNHQRLELMNKGWKYILSLSKISVDQVANQLRPLYSLLNYESWEHWDLSKYAKSKETETLTEDYLKLQDALLRIWVKAFGKFCDDIEVPLNALYQVGSNLELNGKCLISMERVELKKFKTAVLAQSSKSLKLLSKCMSKGKHPFKYRLETALHVMENLQVFSLKALEALKTPLQNLTWKMPDYLA